MATTLIGWASSILLVVTLGVQVRKQWRTRSIEGVSPWLYYGQVLASAGFCVYSALLHNAVFAVTNALGLISALVGVLLYHRTRRARRG